MADANDQIEQEIIRLAHEWIEAIGQRDAATLDRIIADDFLIAGWLPDGRLADKQFYIEDCLKPVNFEQASYNFDRWKVRTYGGVAVANCVFEYHMLVDSQPWGGVFLFTDVWVKEGSDWRVVTRHSGGVMAAPNEEGR